MSFVRSGPKILIVEPADFSTFKSTMLNRYQCKEMPEEAHSFAEVLSYMRRNETLLYIAENGRENISVFEQDRCLRAPEGAQNILMDLINNGHTQLIRYVRKAPRIVIMKIIGDIKGTVTSVADDFHTEEKSLIEALGENSKGTIICFTASHLDRKVHFNELYKGAVYTTYHFSEVVNKLDSQSLKYINRNMGQEMWYDLKIKIYDSYGDYQSQYDRLRYILDKLDVGLILREGWGEDAANIFQIVEIYEVNLFTYYSPQALKKVLLALEYMKNGERIVDYDLFRKRKKIHWDDIRTKEIKTKVALSAYYRKELYDKLDSESIRALEDMEETIFVSR